ncbi:MAG: ATP-dependent helicase [Planctomycetota bacterium]|jgi:DNA helicase-2/ATP-dependent DNA helicase PcrA
MQEKILRQLIPSQHKAVFHKEGPLLVIAGPGSGKTRVITFRIAALIDSGIHPRNICAITFTNKAADEMRQRVFSMGTPPGSHISTFHSLCVRILRQYAQSAGLQANFSIFDAADQARCIKQAVKDSELDTSNFPPAKMLEAVSTLKNKLITAEDFQQQADGFFTRALLKIYKQYQQILQENNALDFDDLLVRTALLLEDDKEVCSKISKRFQYLLIDEYQDTNHAQYRIAKALVCEHNNICATGDPDQSIYRWRGADIRNILDFERDWPNAVIVKLEENFRSTPNILQAADRLIAVNQGRKQKILVPTREQANDVIVNCYEDEQEEAEKVVAQIKQLKADGIHLNQIAVFYRVNAASRVFEEAFIGKKIPYQIVRGVEFYSRKEIRDILAYLKILVNPDDNIALTRIINTPTRGIGKTTVEKVRAYADVHNISFYEALKKADKVKNLASAASKRLAAFVAMIKGFKKSINSKVAPVIERVFAESGLQKSLKDAGTEAKNALDNVEELINKASEYDKDTQEPSLLDFLQQISLFSDVDTYDTAAGRVALMTLHNTKGLEFEAAFITGLEDGILPHERSSEDDDDIEEERRLFFVGITRAKSHLFISFAQYRTIRGQQLRTIPSQFLYELGIETAQQQRERICLRRC